MRPQNTLFVSEDKKIFMRTNGVIKSLKILRIYDPDILRCRNSSYKLQWAIIFFELFIFMKHAVMNLIAELSKGDLGFLFWAKIK